MISEKRLESFREELPVIRAFSGWSLQHLADLLGLSKCTMIAVEHGESKMTTVYYLAIMKLVDDEMDTNEPLAYAVDILHGDSSGFMISRDQLIEEVKKTKKIYGTKIGCWRIKEILGAWLMNQHSSWSW
jgi:transcriptional regulator with XRE-family HTH domain